ncbi:MAG TPA: 16S rRNA (uracil(1498)-N(3))-methyltransferase [Polyangia bacterium]|jgi:16S rRNA (uracil1498-N3)-methyltransferase|nr:16S rRNA (uracil(1498)-N(3))-methyltransferase [Polyangia bacterium]
MSERRLFVPGERLGGPRLTLTGPEHRHVGRVLRARPGDALTLFDGAGGEVEATVVRVERTETELALGARRAVAGPAVSLTLICAVPRGPRMDLLVQKTSELGVARIVPVVTERSVARPDAEGADGKRARWEKIAREAARQCGRADLPIVDPPVALEVALAAPGLPARRLALFEGEKARSLRAALAATEPAATALLVGPEGGFAAAELAVARAAGFEAVGLGERILRVETAAIVAVALVASAYGMLG